MRILTSYLRAQSWFCAHNRITHNCIILLFLFGWKKTLRGIHNNLCASFLIADYDQITMSVRLSSINNVSCCHYVFLFPSCSLSQTGLYLLCHQRTLCMDALDFKATRSGQYSPYFSVLCIENSFRLSTRPFWTHLLHTKNTITLIALATLTLYELETFGTVTLSHFIQISITITEYGSLYWELFKKIAPHMYAAPLNLLSCSTLSLHI